MKRYYFFLFSPLVFWLIDLVYFLIRGSSEKLQALVFGIIAVVLNGLFFFFLYKKSRILAYFFQGSALFIQILLLIYLFLG